MLNTLTTLQKIENKLSDGYETMHLYIEDSTDYDTVTVNIKELLKCIAVDEEYVVTQGGGFYTIYGLGINTDKDGNKLGLCKGNLYSKAAMLNVFADEEECFNFCVKYLMDKNEDGEEQISLAEAKKEVAAQSNGSFKYWGEGKIIPYRGLTFGPLEGII